MLLVSIEEIRGLMQGGLNILRGWLGLPIVFHLPPVRLDNFIDVNALAPEVRVEQPLLEIKEAVIPAVHPALQRLLQTDIFEQNTLLQQLQNDPYIKDMFSKVDQKLNIEELLLQSPTTYYATEEEGVFTSKATCFS